MRMLRGRDSTRTHARGARELRGGPSRGTSRSTGEIIGAGNESRTRDLNLGKVALYQLSYSREIPRSIARKAVSVQACFPSPGSKTHAADTRKATSQMPWANPAPPIAGPTIRIPQRPFEPPC